MIDKPRISQKEAVKVLFPDRDGKPITIQAPGRTWQHSLGRVPEEHSSSNLWHKIFGDWTHRAEYLEKSGAVLGSWLFPEEFAEYLRCELEGGLIEEAPLRIELYVPKDLADWPWEIATIEGIGPLAVRDDLTVMRVVKKNVEYHPAAPLIVNVLGVSLDQPGEWESLNTIDEVERVRLEIEKAGGPTRFIVKVDQLGEWKEFKDRIEREGPPHVFHFAGHGLEKGKGLVFRAANGKAQKISAQVIALLLSQMRNGRKTLLTFLNSCSTASDEGRIYQPFGGLGTMLVQHGIPVVIGHQTMVSDTESRVLAEVFYRSLSRGSSPDCALQSARRELFLSGSSGTCWAFVTGTICGEPKPLCLPEQLRGVKPSASIMEFGHEEQRQRLKWFLKRK